MKAQITKFSLSLVAAAVLAAPAAFAADDTLASGVKSALADSKVKLSFRGRYEGVDQDGVDKRADALTVKTRVTLDTGAYKGFSFGLEVDNVAALVQNYNSKMNGNTEYPVVADPKGTDVNQAFVKYSNDAFSAKVGSQRILHNNQRFVGGVGWRQNEQTYDAARLEYKANGLSADYAYVNNINTILGGDVKGDFHLANLGYKINKEHKVNAFAYLLDYNGTSNNTTNTYGALYNGKFGPVKVSASYATQTDGDDNDLDYSANYYNLEAGTKLGKANVLVGYEVLGSDNGVGFNTPLATKHKFQGFADKFLGTPGQGMRDIYVTGKMKVSGVKLSATYHDLRSDVDSIKYGTEIDLVAAYAIDKNYNVLVKFASYNADEAYTDTNKLWLQAVAKF